MSDRANVYAAGIILYTLLTGQHPFDDDPVRDMLSNHLLSIPPDVRKLEPKVPAALAELVRTCLSKIPFERPPATELAGSLRAYADETGAPELTAVSWVEAEQRTAVEGLARYGRASGAG